MDTGYSTLRSLLYLVMVLVVIAILSNFYVAQQVSKNSEELSRLYQLMQKQVMVSGMAQAEKLQERMEALNKDADGIDAKLKKAQDDLVVRMQTDLPPIIDAKLKTAQGEFLDRMKKELPPIMDAQLKKTQNEFAAQMKSELKRELPSIMNDYIKQNAPGWFRK